MFLTLEFTIQNFMVLGSQNLEPPGGLIFVVQTVCRVEVEFPGGGSSLVLVVQAIRGVEWQSCAGIALVMVVMVMVVA